MTYSINEIFLTYLTLVVGFSAPVRSVHAWPLNLCIQNKLASIKPSETIGLGIECYSNGPADASERIFPTCRRQHETVTAEAYGKKGGMRRMDSKIGFSSGVTS